MKSRTVEQIRRGRVVEDGAGVRLLRVVTGDLQVRLDPFLMLDEFRSDSADDYIAGFPDHPHRGFETVTYMVEGKMRHVDSSGGEGLLESGGVQWMTAGRGVVHSEFPEQTEGRMHGYQLWLNLPGRRKMDPPRYQDIPSSAIPTWVMAEGVQCKLIAGSLDGHVGPAQAPETLPLYVDLQLPTGAGLDLPIPAGHNAFVFVVDGPVAIAGQPADTRNLVILANNPEAEGVRLHAQNPARVLVIAGKPLREPIAQYGPFVMNTQEEIRQAVADFQAGRLG